jgi:hypothetical protein
MNAIACSAIWMSYEPLLFVSVMPRVRKSGTPTRSSTPAPTEWYQRSFGAAASSFRARAPMFVPIAHSASATFASSDSSFGVKTSSPGSSSGSCAAIPPKADHTAIFVTGTPPARRA